MSFFDRYGGVRIFGYPISGEITENGLTVQYFERQRFEFHKALAGTPNEVQLGHLGKELGASRVSLASIARGAAPAGSVFVPATGHSLGAPFLAFWQQNGGVRVLGYPVSEPVTLNGLRVQFFERARLEYHPSKVSLGYGVELGHLGKEYVQARPDVAARIAAGPKPSGAPVGQGISQGLSTRESRILELINNGRAGAGMGRVTLDGSLNQLALSRSTDMVARNYYAHVNPDGKDFIALMREQKIGFKLGGEILSKNNYRDDISADRSYEGWMNSPAHRSIMMDPRYNIAGVGEALSADGYRYYTVLFIQR